MSPGGTQLAASQFGPPIRHSGRDPAEAAPRDRPQTERGHRPHKETEEGYDRPQIEFVATDLISVGRELVKDRRRRKSSEHAEQLLAKHPQSAEGEAASE